MPRTRASRLLWLLMEIGEAYERTEIAGVQRRSAEHLRARMAIADRALGHCEPGGNLGARPPSRKQLVHETPSV